MRALRSTAGRLFRWIARVLASEATFSFIAVASLVTVLAPPCYQAVCAEIRTAVTGEPLPELKVIANCSRCGGIASASDRCLRCDRPELWPY